MEKEKSDKLITEAAKTLFSYCRARTSSKEEAEDLSQDIILELLRTRDNIRDDKAFYGFMWAVAGNGYKDWCKKRNRSIECELDENISDESVPLAELLEKELDLRLLYRELGLLTEQYRQVVIQYYFNGCKVSDISKSMDISESMVKFLLFKSRKILKEGMNMEKQKGDLSFNPGELLIATWGAINIDTAKSFWNLCTDNLIAQNILLACYNDHCTAEEISLQIGVAVPYLERDLKKLCEKDVLIQKGGKFETNIVIFTKEFSKESYEKIFPIQCEIAEIIDKCLNERLEDIKAIGFHRGVDDDNLLKWHIAAIIIGEAVVQKYMNSLNLIFTQKYAGVQGFVCGAEEKQGDGLIITTMDNSNNEFINFLDVGISGVMDSGYFDHYPNRVNILIDIAKGKINGFSENDMFEIAEFINRGFLQKNGDELNLKLPVFTKEQYEKLKILLDDTSTVIADKTHKIIDIVTDILVQHTPVSLKKEAKNVSWMRNGDAIVGPIKIMMDNGILRRVAENAHPTAFVVLA
ncbi:MAG: sigma-70 family RNA polymerase sigma factor [Oscillospiraceae bacterium]|nr:sigma-70 family RNA polymerase sigma factor [Oscillospiraceae bacterium]